VNKVFASAWLIYDSESSFVNFSLKASKSSSLSVKKEKSSADVFIIKWLLSVKMN
jgi:hypothetical protein